MKDKKSVRIEYINALKKLTPREIEILEMTGKGFTSKEISEQVYIAERTVQKHRENIRKKLGIKGRNSMIKWYNKHVATYYNTHLNELN